VPASGFHGLLAASLAAIERDAPACARAIAAALGTAVIELVVDGEPVVVHGGPRVTLAPAGAGPDGWPGTPGVHVATTGPALLALVDGDDELAPAVIANRVRVRAAPGQAERLFDAMRRFVEGCARTTEGPALLAAYRRQAGAPANRPDRRWT
jgi:hypothetical protein